MLTKPIIKVYVAEVFPTSVRSIGTATAMIGDEIGELLAPFVLIIDQIWIPYAVFAVVGVVAAIAGIFLVETRNRTMPETLAEMKRNRIAVITK